MIYFSSHDHCLRCPRPAALPDAVDDADAIRVLHAGAGRLQPVRCVQQPTAEPVRPSQADPCSTDCSSRSTPCPRPRYPPQQVTAIYIQIQLARPVTLTECPLYRRACLQARATLGLHRTILRSQSGDEADKHW